jgi:hypothetical protein
MSDEQFRAIKARLDVIATFCVLTYILTFGILLVS